MMAERQGSVVLTIPDAELPQSFGRGKAKGRTLPSVLIPREEWEEAGQLWSREG